MGDVKDAMLFGALGLHPTRVNPGCSRPLERVRIKRSLNTAKAFAKAFARELSAVWSSDFIKLKLFIHVKARQRLPTAAESESIARLFWLTG
jgi:hypothetical protein